MKFKLLETDYANTCEHDPEHVVLNVTGGMHFNGEPWDDINETFICLDCWADVEPVSEPDFDMSEIPF